MNLPDRRQVGTKRGGKKLRAAEIGVVFGIGVLVGKKGAIN